MPFRLALAAAAALAPSLATAACPGGISFLGATTYTAQAFTATFQHDSGSGSGRLLLVQVVSREFKVHTGVSAAGIPLTKIVDVAGANTSERRMSVWALAAPPAGVSTIVSDIFDSGDHVVSAMTYQGVNPLQPIGAYGGVTRAGSTSLSLDLDTQVENHVSVAFSAQGGSLSAPAYNGGVSRISSSFAGFGNYSFSSQEYAEAPSGIHTYGVTYPLTNMMLLAALELVPDGCWAYTLTPTPTLSHTPTATPSGTPSASPSSTPSLSPSPTASPSGTRSFTPSATPSASLTATASFSRTSTPSITPTQTPAPTGSGSTTATPLASPSLTASFTPTCTPGTPAAAPADSYDGKPQFEPLFPERPPYDRVGFRVPPSERDCRLRVFDLRRRLLREIQFASQAPSFDGRDGGGSALASGHYYYVLECAGFSHTGQLAVLR